MSNQRKISKTKPQIFIGYVETQKQVFIKPHGKCKILNICLESTLELVTLVLPNKVGFFPIANNDVITAMGTLVSTGEYSNGYLVMQLPAGIISDDDITLGKVLNSCIYDNCDTPVNVDNKLKIVNSISAAARNNGYPNDTFGYLEYCANKLAAMITTPAMVELVERLKSFGIRARGFIYTWYRKRSKRQLSLFHHTIGDIVWYEPDKLIDMIEENPFKVPIIAPDIATCVAKRYGCDITDDDINYHKLSTFIYKKMVDNSWVCVPIAMIPIHMLTKIDVTDEKIMSKYYMVKDDDSLYLIYPKICEESLAKKFKMYMTEGEQELKAKPANTRDNIDMESLDNAEKVSLIKDLADVFDLADYMKATKDDMAEEYDKDIDDSLIEMAREAIMLGEEQREALKFALTNRVSIIGGCAGTGKCFGLNTPILMYD